MLLTDITKIIRVLLAAYQPLASQDNLTQRRLGQIGEVIGAVEDVAETEEADSPSPKSASRKHTISSTGWRRSWRWKKTVAETRITDQDMYDVAVSLSGLMASALVEIVRPTKPT